MNFTPDLADAPTLTPGTEAAPKSRIEYGPQNPNDSAALEAIVPSDQERFFRAGWQIIEGRRKLVLEECEPPANPASAANPADAQAAEDKAALEAETKRVAKMNSADAQTLAAERKVAWDPKASRSTMNERIAGAMPKPV